MRKILKQKIVKAWNKPYKVTLYDKDLNWVYEVVAWTMFCNITWDRSLNAFRNWMNTCHKISENKKEMEKFFNSLKPKQWKN